jgi:hypothetical protein
VFIPVENFERRGAACWHRSTIVTAEVCLSPPTRAARAASGRLL